MHPHFEEIKFKKINDPQNIRNNWTDEFIHWIEKFIENILEHHTCVNNKINAANALKTWLNSTPKQTTPETKT